MENTTGISTLLRRKKTNKAREKKSLDLLIRLMRKEILSMPSSPENTFNYCSWTERQQKQFRDAVEPIKSTYYRGVQLMLGELLMNHPARKGYSISDLVTASLEKKHYAEKAQEGLSIEIG